MAPPRKANTAKPVEPKVNGVKDNKKPAVAAKPTRGKKATTEQPNGTVAEPVKAVNGTGRSRTKKTATPDAPEQVNAKRKKVDESDGEAAPKPKKTKVKTDEAVKTKVPGPRRVRGRKVEINTLRHTDPLKVFVFGEGSAGELGLGAFKAAINVKRPRFNQKLSDLDVVRVATGGMHVVALTKDNKIITWGVNDNGALGRDTSQVEVKMKDIDDAASDSDSDDDPTGGLNELEATPTAISPQYFPDDAEFVDVAAGDSCSFAITTEGAVYGWGTFRKNEGVLGFTKRIPTAWRPVYIETVQKITQIACGTNHVIAIDRDGHVWAWGNGQQNQLGRRVTERSLQEALVPNRVGFHDKKFKGHSQKIAKIACGDYHCLALGTDGHVWAWGANNFAECGYPDNAGADDADVPSPKIIESLKDLSVVDFAAGSHHNMVMTKQGQIYVWGRCDSAQTGLSKEVLDQLPEDDALRGSNGKPKILVKPTPISSLSGIVTAACGPDHTLAIDSQGKAHSWGFNENWQLGHGPQADGDIWLPTLIDNTAVREEKLMWSGAGGQYSMLASVDLDKKKGAANGAPMKAATSKA